MFPSEHGRGAAGGGVEHPLSHGQRALWFLSQLSPDSPAYNSVHAACVAETVDVAALRRAFQRLVDRHPCLRTTFASRGGEPVQRVHPEMEAAFTVEDARSWSDEAVEQRLADESFRPFDLSRGPLIRVLCLLRRPGCEPVVAVTVHHIVIDLWSWAILLRELGVFYSAERAGLAAPLEPLGTSYLDHVRAERELLAGPEGERLWQFWRERLAGDVPLLDLPLDHARPAHPTHRGAAQSIRIDAALTRQLKALGRRHAATPFKTLLAAYLVLLHRWTGQEDLLVGCPSAGRNDPAFATVLGYFVNLFVVREKLSGDASFVEVLQHVRDTVGEAIAHAQYPHALLVERLQPARHLSRSPLVQTVFTWQRTSRLLDSGRLASFALGEHGATLQLDELSVHSMAVKQQPAPFDLTLLMAEAGSELVATFEYQTDLFDATTIAAKLEHFRTLLAGIAEDPHRPVSRIPLVTPAERERLLATCTGKGTPVEAGPHVHLAFSAQAARTPQAVAVAGAERELTYAELDRRSTQLARYLRRRGVGPDAIAAACLDRSPELLVALLAVLKSGGAWLPIDPATPPERIGFMVQDSRAAVVVTERRLRDRIPAGTAEVVCVDGPDAAAIAAESVEPVAELGGADAVAYVIYTSGSTGEPKGVLVGHEAFALHCRDVIDHYGLGPGDRVLQFASPSFDAALEQMVPPLLCGARLVLRPPELPGGAAFHDFVARHRLTVVNVPPAYWREWARACAGAAHGNEQVRLVIVGGDVMQPDAVELWRRTSMAGARLLNAYGPTETTITATTYEVPPGAVEHGRRMPIGRAVGRRTLYVVDRHGELVPVGTAGELYVGGPYLARGYLNRPELTAARFVHDPFSARPGARVYRTGDMVRWLPDGSLEFLGRHDDQVKVRGFRIELSEIEAALARHPAIREAAVVAQEFDRGTAGERRIVAYVCLKAGETVGAGALRNDLGARLPDYMVPSTFVMLDALPRTAGGKVDRRALLAVSAAAGRAGPIVEPRNAVETEVAGIWAEVLSVDRVGVHDDFFELGGHSLLATQVVARLRETFGVEVPLRDLFELPTVAGLASGLVRRMAAEEAATDLEHLLQEIEALPEPAVERRPDRPSPEGAPSAPRA